MFKKKEKYIKTTTINTPEESERLIKTGVVIINTLMKSFTPQQASAIITAFLIMRNSDLTTENLKYALEEYLKTHTEVNSDAIEAAKIIDQTENAEMGGEV